MQRLVMEKVDFPETDEEEEVLDWTYLPDDAAIAIFSRLSCPDRANLSSTCRSFRVVGNSPCLWQVLDLRPHNCDYIAALSLASRCKNLLKLQLGCPETAYDIINLQAKNLRELSVEDCLNLKNQTLDLLAARHEALECLQINGPASRLCAMINTCSVKAIAMCCPQLKRLWISGARQVDANAINAFAENCKNLTDIGFVDCGGKVDVAALGNIVSLKFISVAGTSVEYWEQVLPHWSKLPCLIGLDVSRTYIPPDIVLGFFSSLFRCLRVVCALFCPRLKGGITIVSNDDHKGKVAVSVFTDILTCNFNYEKSSEISNWLEWIVSSSLRGVSKRKSGRLDNIPRNQFMDVFLRFLQSAQEEVQEKAVTALANFLAYDENGFTVAVMRSGDVIRLLLNLALSSREVLQSEVAKVIANLSGNDEVVKGLLEKGGISILANLARSASRSVAKEALVALSKLEGAIDEVIGAKTLVQLTRICHDGVRIKAARALGNLCCADRNREVVAEAGGVEALVALVNSCSNAPRELQWSAAGALWELSRSEAYSIAVCQEGGVASLIARAKSDEKVINVVYAMAALWSLASYPKNALHIIEESGIDTIAHLSSSSCYPKVTRLFSALALTCMFDKRMDEIVRMGSTRTKSVELERARRIATKHIEVFVKTVSDSQFACIHEAGELIFSEAEIGRFVAMLQNPCPAAVKSCVAFALGQFTVSSAKNGAVHVSFLRNAGAQSVLQQAVAEDELLETKIFARQVLRNMDWFSYSESGKSASSLGWLNHAHRRE